MTAVEARTTLPAEDPAGRGTDDIVRQVVSETLGHYRGVAFSVVLVLILVVAAPSRSPKAVEFSASSGLAPSGARARASTTPSTAASTTSSTVAPAPAVDAATSSTTTMAPPATTLATEPTTSTTTSTTSTTSTTQPSGATPLCPIVQVGC